MERPTKDEVRIALLVTRPGAAIGPNVACVLAAEVRALQEQYEHAVRLHANVSAELTELKKKYWTATGLGELRAAIARIEALCNEYPTSVWTADVRKALRGEP